MSERQPPDVLGARLAEAERALRSVGQAYAVRLTAPPGGTAAGDAGLRRVLAVRREAGRVMLIAGWAPTLDEVAGDDPTPGNGGRSHG